MRTRRRRQIDPSRLWPFDCRGDDGFRARVIDVETGEQVRWVIAAAPNEGVVLRFVPGPNGFPGINATGDGMNVELVRGRFRVEVLKRADPA